MQNEVVRVNLPPDRRHYDAGLTLLDQGLLDQARACFEAALKTKTLLPATHNCLGVISMRQGRTAAATYHFEQASALDPNFAMPEANLGWILYREHCFDAAIMHFRAALRIAPQYDEPHIGLGTTFYQTGDFGEALAHFNKALTIDATCARAHYSLGLVHKATGDLMEAISATLRAIELRPNYSKAIAQLVYLLNLTCRWDQLAEWMPTLERITSREVLAGEMPGINPVQSMRYFRDPGMHLAVARAWSSEIHKRHADSIHLSPDRYVPFTPGKLRIGYVSGVFGNHPVSRCIRGLLSRHDRTRFDVRLYAHNEDDGSQERADLRAASDILVDIGLLSPREAANKIRSDGIDILIDLDGHDAAGRLELFARRPAPVQVAYFGFVASTGAAFIDYIIADEIVFNSAQSEVFDEQPVFMPDAFFVDTDSLRRIDDFRLTRQEYGLPPDSFVFCCFNDPSKIDRLLFSSWMRILRELPDSVLWLLSNNLLTEETLVTKANEHGIDPTRLIFAERTDLTQHINRLRLADVALDTHLYNGGVTTSNALAAGVPVVTTLGNRFASRMSASMLSAMGIPELVATDLQGYTNLATTLARSPDWMTELRVRLQRNRQTSPLFDEKRFAKNLERAFLTMFEVFRAGAEPRAIWVRESN